MSQGFGRGWFFCSTWHKLASFTRLHSAGGWTGREGPRKLYSSARHPRVSLRGLSTWPAWQLQCSWISYMAAGFQRNESKSHQSPQDELWGRHSITATTFCWSKQGIRGGRIREEDKQSPPPDACSSMLTLGWQCLWP